MSYALRLASREDFDAVMAFYADQHSIRLPAPSFRSLTQAIENYQLLIVVDSHDGTIAATAGTFDMTSPVIAHHVGELAGTRVTRRLGGIRPWRMQTILIVLRVLMLAASSVEGSEISLIVIIRKDNDASRSNILTCGFEPLETRPAWLLYDALSWNGQTAADEWDYFHATQETARRCAEIYMDAKLYRPAITLAMADQPTELSIDLPGLQFYQYELWDTLAGDICVPFAPPPPRLL